MCVSVAGSSPVQRVHREPDSSQQHSGGLLEDDPGEQHSHSGVSARPSLLTGLVLTLYRIWDTNTEVNFSRLISFKEFHFVFLFVIITDVDWTVCLFFLVVLLEWRGLLCVLSRQRSANELRGLYCVVFRRGTPFFIERRETFGPRL